MPDQERMHVLHAVLSLDVGGLERIVVDLMREGQKLGQRTSVLCLERPGELAAQVEDMGASLVCADKRPGKRPGLSRALVPVLRGLRSAPALIWRSHGCGAN
jgi:hypothetical protein